MLLVVFDGKILTVCLPYKFRYVMLAVLPDFNPRLISSLV